MPDQAQPERGAGWLIFLASAAILLLCICAIAVTISLALGGSVLAIVRAEQIESDVTVQAPARVEQGLEFVIEVLVGNPSSDELLLDSIDVAATYLDGVSIARSDPPYRDSIRILGYTSYEFRHPIPVGETLGIELQAVALAAGDYRGEIDVCINTGFSCRTFQVRTVITGE